MFTSIPRVASYAQHTIQSKNILKRWLHKQRFSSSLRLLDLHDGDSFLDYGCGDGELSLQVHRRYPHVSITAFDPATPLFVEAQSKLAECSNVIVAQSIDMQHRFSRIACLETVEHLPKEELDKVLSNIHHLLVDGGTCLLSFPIEHGVMSLVKNMYRILTKRDSYATFSRAIRCFFGLSVPRQPIKDLGGCRYIYSHVGFRCRNMIARIQEQFNIVKITVLPFGWIMCGLGNSIALVARKR